MQTRRMIVAFVGLAAVALPRSVVVAEPTPSVLASLVVTGTPGCVSRAELLQRIAQRSARIRLVDRVGVAAALRVTIDASSARGVVASLSIVWPDGSRSERPLVVPTCADTADAIALVIVLALDPAAANPYRTAPSPRRTARPERRTGPTARATAARDRPGSAPVAAPPTTPAPADDTPPATPAAQPTPAIAIAAPAAPDHRPIDRPIHRFDVGAALRFAHGPAPLLMPGVGLSAAWDRTAPSRFSWAVHLIAAHHARGGWGTPGGSADFALDLLTVHLCPLRLGSRAARAQVCATAAAGRMIARGRDTLSPRTHARPLVNVGGAAVLAVAPHRRVEVTASVEPQAALIRDHFAFGPRVFYDVPPLALYFGMGASLRFP